MKKNKIKYLGLCAATLLTIAPVASSTVITSLRPISVETVRADALDDSFVTSLKLTKSQLKDLSTGSIDTAASGAMTNGSVDYLSSNILDPSAASADLLYDKIKPSFLKLFVKESATVGGLSISNNITLKISDGISNPGNESDVLNKIKSLNVGGSFKVTISSTGLNNKVIPVTIVSEPSTKLKLSPLGNKTLSGTSVTKTDIEQGQEDLSAIIKDTSGRKVFHKSDINGDYFYALNGNDTFSNSGTTLDIPNGENGIIFNQLIPINYTNAIASNIDANSLVFLNSANKITKTAPNPGSSAKAYVMRKIIIGSPAQPIFKYTTTTQGTSVTSTLNDGDSLVPNSVDITKLVYQYNDQTSLNKLRDYLYGDFQRTNGGAGNFTAFKSTASNDVLSINFELPSVSAKSSPQFVIATATSNAIGTVSKVKIPIKVENIPNPALAPEVTKFPKGDILVNSKVVSKYDPMYGVAATYVGTDNAKHDLPKRYITVTVKDANGKNVNLNSDGTIPTTKTGTYKINYVFSNPTDSSKNTTKDLTMKVNEVNLSAPTVSGFNENAVYTLSNNKQKEVSPFAQILGMADVKATYVGTDGKTYEIPSNSIKVEIKNSYGQIVDLNSNNCISMEKTGTYSINYTWANPEDTSKVVKKSSTLVVNSTISQSISPKFTNNEIANPTIDTNQTSFNVLANTSFNLIYKDPESSTPSTPLTLTVPNNSVTVKVTKNGEDVPLTNYSFKPTEGVYTISYTVTNPKDNVDTLNYSRTLTVKKASSDNSTSNPNPSQPTIQYSEGVVWINYVPGYGINLWLDHDFNHGAERNYDGSLRKLMHGSAWKFSATATYPDGSQWFKLGNNQWIPAQYASYTPINTWNETSSEGVGVVKYVPGYGINVWTNPDQNEWTKKLPDGSAWKYFKIATKNGKTMYNLGGNQWVDGNYFFPNK